MSKMVRLSESEQDAIRLKAMEINKLLVKKGLQPLKDSELLHKILELSIPYVFVTPQGEFYMELADAEAAVG